MMNGLLTAATLFAGGYCWVLARRVHDLKSLDKGLGGSIVALTRQIELARSTLDEAQADAKDTRGDLKVLIAEADAAAGKLKLALAAARVSSADRPDPVPDQVDAEAPPAPEPPVSRPATAVAPAARPEPLPSAPPRMLADITSLFGETPPAVLQPASDAPPEDLGPPKPRSLPPIANPLRRRDPIAPVRSEDELMDVLNALAAGGAR
jgi:hypothetical protein